MKKLLAMLIAVSCLSTHAISISVAIDNGVKYVGRTLNMSPMVRATFLNFPPLPKEILDRANKRPVVNTVNTTYNSYLSQYWPLSNIGFFEIFTPLIQPVRTDTRPCSKDIVVAVIDTGIDYTHPELKDNIWVNKGETGYWAPPANLASMTSCRDKSCNGIDDDGNGFIDDVIGWDFVNDQPLPYDVHGHGTHIAGIISSKSEAGVYMVGVCTGATIMPLKYYDNSGLGNNNLQNTVRAIHYATKMGANIINYSGGGSDPAKAEKEAIEEAMNKGVLFIAAAGNDDHNDDKSPYYPANYGLENIVSVASADQNYKLLPSSNYGNTVNIAAPGLSILSTLPAGRFGTMSGTSQATAFVTGTAAVLASQFKSVTEFDFRKVKHWLMEGAQPLIGDGSLRSVGTGFLSISKSMRIEKDEMSGKKVIPKPGTPNNSSTYRAPKSLDNGNTVNHLYRGW